MIKSHITKPSVYQLWSSVKLKVVRVCVCVCASVFLWATMKDQVSMSVCVPAAPQLHRGHHDAIHSHSLWRVSDKPHRRTAWCADTDKNVFLKCFAEGKKDGKISCKSRNTRSKCTENHSTRESLVKKKKKKVKAGKMKKKQGTDKSPQLKRKKKNPNNK